MVSLTLPFPVSVNRLWRGGQRRIYKSREYNLWLYEAGNKLVEQKPAKIVGNYELTVWLYPPDKRRRDLDNYFKCISDLLEHHNVIENDWMCRELSAIWMGIDKEHPRAEVGIIQK